MAIQVNDENSYNVLANSKSRLVACFIKQDTCRLFTIDIHCLIRQWDLVTGQCIKSYILEIP